MKLYLIRHGQTDWNLQGRFQGREDIPLNENGIRQAEQCGMALRGETYDAIISSPLLRAKKTAEIIAKYVLLKDVITEQDLIERDFSGVSGLTPQEREVFYAAGKLDRKEPMDQVYRRMISVIHKYYQIYPEGKIIMVSHGASINSVISNLINRGSGTGKVLLKNTCINIIDYHKDRMKLEVFNVTADEYMELVSICTKDETIETAYTDGSSCEGSGTIDL